MQNCPAVTQYMERIGADQRNFRTWQVKEFKGQYYWEKCSVNINKDGIISCKNAGYLPTADEQDAIKAQWHDQDLPTVIPVNNTKGIKLNTTGSVLFEFYDDNGKIIFVQERCEPKAYIPWTYWSDNKWRMLHPETMPFWKPKRRRKVGKIMIHEGAKAAKAANELTPEHPWYDELKEYEHWGCVGGALSVNYADYPALRAERVRDPVYVCDNDWAGRSVLQEFSRNYGQRLIGVKFDNRFDEGFDLYDPLPEAFFNEEKKYIGPDFEQFKSPATFATEIIPQEKGKPQIVLRKSFLEEWLHCITPEAYIHKEYPAKVMTAREFDGEIRPYSDVEFTSKLVLKDGAGKGHILRYNPGLPPGTYASEEGYFINTHQPPHIAAKAGSAKPFLEFMEHLVPDENDRGEVLRWCATLIAHPEIKMHYGLLMISETQGVGKGTLGEKILAPLVGPLNVSFPGEEDIVNSQYNYWMAHHRLAVVHEIYAGHSSRAYNKLKSVITDKYIDVHRKYMADYQIENWLHIFACSNSPRALKLSMDDRRWLVPRVTYERRDEEYWSKFHHWLNRLQGLNKIMAWAEGYNQLVRSGETAPWTGIKRDIIEEGYSPGQTLVNDALVAIRDQMKGDERVIIADTGLVDLIRDVIHGGSNAPDRLEKPGTVRTIAKSLGWYIGDDRVKFAEWGTLLTRPRLIFSHEADMRREPRDLVKEGRKLFDVQTFYNNHKRV